MKIDKKHQNNINEALKHEIITIISAGKYLFMFSVFSIPIVIALYLYKLVSVDGITRYLIATEILSIIVTYVWFSKSTRMRQSSDGFPKYAKSSSILWLITTGSLPLFDLNSSNNDAYLFASFSTMWCLTCGAVIVFGMLDKFTKPIIFATISPSIIMSIYHQYYEIGLSALFGAVLISLCADSASSTYQTILTEKVQAEQQATTEAEIARKDWLTGILNRYGLFQTVEEDPKKYKSTIFIDLDKFKEINDNLGHIAGDETLRVVAKRLQAIVRPQDLLCRLGGDEFVIISTISDRTDLENFATRILNNLEKPIKLEKNMYEISASIGISTANTNFSIEEMLNKSDSAMLKAKQEGKGRAIFV